MTSGSEEGGERSAGDGEFADASPPLVSFITSTYAGDDPAELRRSLESAVRQDYPAVEVVLVIDGPVPDGIREAVDEVRASTTVPIRVASSPVNQKLGRSLNQAISIAGGDLLARMDADDYSMPERIRLQVEYLGEHPDVDVVGCLMEEVFEDGTASCTRMPLTHATCVAEFVRRDPIHHPTAVFRRRFFEKAGLYSGEICDDSALWLSGIRAGCHFGNVDKALYRMYLDGKFFSRRKNLRWIWWVLVHRLRIVRELGYGMKGYFFAVVRAATMLLPRSVLELAYQQRNRSWKRDR